MKKLKNIKLINIIFITLICAVNIILCFLFKFNLNHFYFAAISLIAIGLINIIFIAIKEAMILSYDSNKYEPIVHIGHIFVGAVGLYLVKYVKGYDRFLHLYWIGLSIGIVIPIIISFVIMTIKNKRKNSNDKPKFLVNKK